MGRVEKKNTIIILGAVYQEVDILIDTMKNILIEEQNGFRFYVENREFHRIVIGITGCGCMNGCLATLTAICKYMPDRILNIGTCGAYREEYCINDIFVINKAIYIGDLITQKRTLGTGSNPFQWQIRPQEYFADEKLLSDIIKGISSKNIKKGIIGTSDIFNREEDRIRFIRNQLDIDCEDMETAAIYKAAALAGVAVAAIRVISNNELTGERGKENKLGISRDAQIVLQKYCQALLPELLELA